MDDKDLKQDATHIEHAEDHGGAVDYRNNVHARIRNPLGELSKSALHDQVGTFCGQYGFEDKEEVFQKAAQVAQRPHEFEKITDLDENDRYWLKREITNKWHLPRQLWYAIIIVSIGSAVQGWDNTGANAANLSFPQEFGIENNEWLIGFVNAAPALFGLATAWAADPVQNLLGRRGTIFATGLFVIFPVLAQAFTQNWQGLLICRLFMGLGMGIKISCIPIYSAEVSPAVIRGAMVTSFQLWVALGILVGYSSNLIFFDIGDNAWRFQLGAAFAPAVPLVFIIWLVPESPRWYMKKGRYQDAFRSFCRLRHTELQAARDLYYAHAQMSVEEHAFGGKSLGRRAIELLTVPRLRRATISSSIIVISQQFSGINIIAFYSSTVFAAAGYTDKQCLLASFGFGLVTFLFAFPAIWTMDKFGRRPLLLFTFPNMAWCLLAAGLCFYMDENNSARVPLIAFFIFLFGAFYGPGIGPIPSIYFSESFPLSHREIGGGAIITVNNAVGSALGLTFPSLLAKLGPTGAFGFYTGLCMLAFFVIFFIVPETKQRTLEELDYIFSVPTRRHARYQVGTWLPWWFKHYILFQRKLECKPLYQTENFAEGTVVEYAGGH